MDVIELGSCYKFLRAGPFKEVVFKPEEIKAAIVTVVAYAQDSM